MQPEGISVPAQAYHRPQHRLMNVLKKNVGFFFILPALLLFLIFGLYTVIFAVVLSFFRWNGFGDFSIFPPRCELPECAFVGLENFQNFLYFLNYQTGAPNGRVTFPTHPP